MRMGRAADLGALVRAERDRQGLTRAALAGRAGVSERWLGSFEGGKATVELALVWSCLDALGLRVEVTSKDRSMPAGAPVPAVDLDDHLAAYAERGSGA